MKRIILYFIIFVLTIAVYGQVVDLTGKSQKTELIKLDRASIRCYYQFVQKDRAIRLQIDTMTLDIGAVMSEYYDIAKQKQDSLYSAYLNKIPIATIRNISVLKQQDAFEDEGAGSSSHTTGRMKESARLFKNRQTGEIIIIDVLSAEKYRFTETVSPQNWQIAADTATILGYLCQKATATFRGRSYEAWFSPEIPVNDGPWKFFGLPGLILKVTDTDGIFSFVCAGMENLNPPRDITMEQTNYIDCSRNDLAKIKTRKGGETKITNNGGNIVIASLKAQDNAHSLELE